jgi:hypothetical protein
MIKVNCRTHLDDVKEGWPTELPAVPSVGDLIENAYTLNNGVVLRLKVVRITWVRCDQGQNSTWKPEIELHLGSQHKSVSHFEAWLAYHRGNISMEIYQTRLRRLQTDIA